MKRLLLITTLTLGLMSCEKDQQMSEPTYKDLEFPKVPVSDYKFADATLQATYQSTLKDNGLLGYSTYYQGLGHAGFRSTAGSFEPCDEVKVEGQPLGTLNSRYEYNPGKDVGIDYGSSVSWEINGAGRIPDITHEVTEKVPEIGDITVGDSLELRKDLQLAVDNDSPYTQLGKVDSLVVRIIGQKGEFERRQGYGEPTIFASSSELETLGKGPAYIQVSAFRVESLDFEGGYKIAFVNKGVFTRKIVLY